MRMGSWIRYEQTTCWRAASMPRRATDRLTLGAPHSGNAARTKRARSANYTRDWWFRRTGMNFQRVLVGLVILLAASFYMNWKMLTQLRTVKAFVEGSVFADAVAACERAQSTTPFKWNGGKQTAVVGLNSVKPNKDTVIASYTLVADSVFCDYDPIKKKADIGSNFLERE